MKLASLMQKIVQFRNSLAGLGKIMILINSTKSGRLMHAFMFFLVWCSISRLVVTKQLARKL